MLLCLPSSRLVTSFALMGALILGHRQAHGILQWGIVQLQLAWMHLGLLRLTEHGSWASWPLVQWEVHRLLSLEGQKRLALARASRGAPPRLDNWLFRRFTSLALGMAKRPAPMGGMAAAPPTVKDLVLVGGGHAHVHVIKMLGMQPEPGVQLTLVTRDVETPYSGMLPGYVAGLYTRAECHIDLAKLCAFAGCRLVHAEAVHVDTRAKEVHLRGRPPIPYDVLSIDIGSAPKPISRGCESGASITPVKPIDGFCARWDVILSRVLASDAAVRQRIVVVGGGAGGVELALSMQARLHREAVKLGRDPQSIEVVLVSRSTQVLPQHSIAVRKIFEKLLAERKVEVQLARQVTGATATDLLCSDGQAIPFDEAIWCTQGGAQEWLRGTNLALDNAGFIAVHPSLESINTPDVFAAGDVAAVLEHPRPKAGVFAVRQGPPLTANLRSRLLGRAVKPFVPQTRFLGLIGAGDGNCVASKGPMALEGRWLWDLKDWIDRTWMAMYSHALPQMGSAEPPPPEVAKAAGAEALQALSHTSMRCGGCGAKVGATVLSRVMARLKDGGHLAGEQAGVLLGLDAPDDCAVLAPSSLASVHTVDFFRSFIDDPYVFGQVAANHALSDAHAMGAQPTGALAVAVVPYGLEVKVEETLFQMMSGACKVLREAGCALLGGHTCEGHELSLGFCVTGHVAPEAAMRKGGMNAGEAIILTKPLGTGVLFAAHMRGSASGWWLAAALQQMTMSNDPAARCLMRHGASACTDVTGFGLLGHLVEMAKASKALIALRLSRVRLGCIGALMRILGERLALPNDENEWA
mmetsp:Transcript_16065/g.38519  ORF Transcript_16065/g.38519 Transcript_16065/m.38519 type:complete len:808 (-) Transcript_16065:795-3218(-)